MFSILFRRLQRFLPVIKLVVIVTCFLSLGWLVINSVPTIGTILFFSLVLFVFLLTLLSVFMKTRTCLLVSLSVAFLIFLKAVELLNWLNLGLFTVFLVFLGIYLYKQPGKG